MANPLRIKRRLAGSGAGSPSSLINAELAFNEFSKILYYGIGGDDTGSSGIITIGGEGAFGGLSTTNAWAGTTNTFTSAVVLTGAVSGAGILAYVTAFRLDQFAAPNTSVTLNSQRITNLADPTSAQDAATKSYVDAARTGLDVKASVRVASTANITLAWHLINGSSIDGITVATGDRVLLKNQTVGAANGIYVVVASGAASRSADADSSPEVTSGMFTFVEEGTINGGQGFVLTTANTIDLGSTALVFTQFSGVGDVVAGDGLTKTGNTVDAVGTTNRISVSANAIDIHTSYVGQASITTVGTLTNLTVTNTIVGSISGNAGTATKLATARTINTVSFDGSANIVVTAAADTLTGTTLASNVLTSSLTTIGTITAGVWNSSTLISLAYGGTGANLSAASAGTIFKTNGTILVAATLHTDYLNNASIIDGGTF